MAMNQVQLTSLRLLKSASIGLVDRAVHPAVRHRSQVLPSVVSGALAEGISLSQVRASAAVSVSSRGSCVLPMPCVSSSDDADQRDGV